MAKKLSKPKIKKLVFSIVKDYLQNVENKIKVKRAILFGSAAQGEMSRGSDIDLIILSTDFKKIEFIERLIFLSKLRSGMKQLSPMDIFGYTPEEFKRMSNKSKFYKRQKEKEKLLNEILCISQ